MVGAVVKLRTAAIGALEGVAHVEKTNADRVGIVADIVEIFVVAVDVVHQRQLVAANVAGGGHHHKGHRRVDRTLELREQSHVVGYPAVILDGLVDQIAVIAHVNAACAVVALGERGIGVDAYPGVAKRKMVGKVGLKILAELTAEYGFGVGLGKARQHTLFGGAVAQLGHDDKQQCHRRQKAAEDERGRIADLHSRLGCGRRRRTIRARTLGTLHVNDGVLFDLVCGRRSVGVEHGRGGDDVHHLRTLRRFRRL